MVHYMSEEQDLYSASCIQRILYTHGVKYTALEFRTFKIN